MWYADDATGGGKLEQLRRWWDKLNECGPAFGYFPNAVKTWLIVKESQLALAKELFCDTGVQITTEGHRLLGAPVGTQQFCERYVEDAVASLKQPLETLASRYARSTTCSLCCIHPWLCWEVDFSGKNGREHRSALPASGGHDSRQAHPSVDRSSSPRRYGEGATGTASSFRWHWLNQSCHSPSKRIGAFDADMCPSC